MGNKNLKSKVEQKGKFLVNGQFKLNEKLGSGSFGKIYECRKLSDNSRFAVKFETEQKEEQLNYEQKIYQILKKHHGFPKIQHFGILNKTNYLIMDLLGRNLGTLFEYCGRKFSLKTVLMIADQILRRIQLLHTKSFVYRDIKPENFCIGKKKNKNQIFMIDFGLSKLYRDFWTHKFNKYKQNRNLIGTVRYSSVNTHLGIEQTRRDDLESLGYMLIYFLKGGLPWQGLKSSSLQDRNSKICDNKLMTSTSTLCEGLPVEFKEYIEYCKNLSFKETPNYSLLRRKFQNLFLKKGYVYDYEYDWVKIKKLNLYTGQNKTISKSKSKFINKQEIQNSKENKNIVFNNINIGQTKDRYIKKRVKTETKTQNEIENIIEKIQKKSLNNSKSKINVLSTDSEMRSETETETETEKDDKTEKEYPENVSNSQKQEEKINQLIKQIQKYDLPEEENQEIKDQIEKQFIKQQKSNDYININHNKEEEESEEEEEEEAKKIDLKEKEPKYFLRNRTIYKKKFKKIKQKIQSIEDCSNEKPHFLDKKIRKIKKKIKKQLKKNINFGTLYTLKSYYFILSFVLLEKQFYSDKYAYKKNKKKIKKEQYMLSLKQIYDQKKKLITKQLSLIESICLSGRIILNSGQQKKLAKLQLKVQKKKKLSLKKFYRLFEKVEKFSDLIILLFEQNDNDVEYF
ncbi:casein kinase i-like protein [Anaeramoeba flamelloides]|uniref:non-specific serine/threonine protein kinase n=1 Tax=Anaeramoeba flamelloides TaxID=1746091 RepID=A0AAV7Z5M4_9EUKA|nr:casein kinase i-like protein [Anaeramoeba flamelloides]